MKAHGVRIQIVFDNTFDTGLNGQDAILMDLTRAAFEFDHHLIAITQSEEAANEVGCLNGDRTRIVEQKEARSYRWSNAKAREYTEILVIPENET